MMKRRLHILFLVLLASHLYTYVLFVTLIDDNVKAGAQRLMSANDIAMTSRGSDKVSVRRLMSANDTAMVDGGPSGVGHCSPPIGNNEGLRGQLRTLGVTKYKVYCNSRRSADPLPLIMLVHHREFHAGCHSFERFLNPRWETIFVVGEDMAKEFQLQQLARAADSPGVHLALLNRTMTGEWLGRKVALLIMNHLSSPPPLLILSGHCDIHPLPEWHKMHVTFETTVSRMVAEFLKEDKLNQMQHSHGMEQNPMWDLAPLDKQFCERVFKDNQRPLLVMNTPMVETLPSTENLNGSKFHSKQVGLERPWKECSSRPHGLHPDTPWMSEVSTWVEDHFALYNTTLLSQIVDPFAMVHDTVSAGVKALPQLLCKRGWKAVRLNDSPLFYDFAKQQLHSKGLAGTRALFERAKYGPVSPEWLFTRSVINLARVNSPTGCLKEYMRLRVFADLDVSISCIIAHHHFQPNHIADSAWKLRIHENEPITKALMKLHGYELAKRTKDYLMFVSVPAPYTAKFESYSASLESNIHWNSSGSLPGGRGALLNVIALDRNSTLRRESFFNGYKLRQNYRAGAGSPDSYHRRACRICQWIKSQHEWETSSLLTPKEVLMAMFPISENCIYSSKCAAHLR